MKRRILIVEDETGIRENLREMLEAEGLRSKLIVVCGGPRISHDLDKELGYDAGFGMNTYADDVASFIAQEMQRRLKP